MSTAFLVLCHSDPALVARSARRLCQIGDVLVHVDAKADIRTFLEATSDATFVRSRVAVSWAGYSMVEATLRLIEFADCRQYRRIVLLSGTSYPIMPNDAIANTIQALKNTELIHRSPTRATPSRLRQIEYLYFNDALAPYSGSKAIRHSDKLLRKGLSMAARVRRGERIPNHLTPYWGSQWWTLTGACARYVLDVSDRYATMFRNAFSPDEHFFHTIVGNSPFARFAPPPTLTTRVSEQGNLHYLDVNMGRVFSDCDAAELATSGKVFVRKVSSVQSKSLLDRLDDEDARLRKL